jgi:uncharacterized protein (TIGR03067 family)
LLVLAAIYTNTYGQPVDGTAVSIRRVEKDEQGRILAVVLGSEGGDATLQQIAPLKHLRRFNANDSKMTDAGLEHLGGLTHLTHLYLDNTKVTMAGLVNSGLLGRLVLLSVEGTEVTLEDRRRIRQGFPKLALLPLDAGSPRSSDLLRLQGKWIAVSGEVGGRPLKREQLDDIAVTVRGDQLKRKPRVLVIVLNPNDPQEKPLAADVSHIEQSFRLDPTQNPKHLDVRIGWSGTQRRTSENGWECEGKPTYAKSIYSVKGDRLRICWGDWARPTHFETNKNDGLSLITYKRTGPEQRKQ